MKKYISTKELNDKYGVSNVTVAKWLLLTSKAEVNLSFDKVGKRIRILDSAENWQVLDVLGKNASDKRQKIFSSKAKVDPIFYTYFNKDELTEIARDLEYKRNINYKFTYKGEGADYWDQFYQENVELGAYKTPKRTKEVLDYYVTLITDKMKNFDQVNIVEIGPGNALPVVNFIKKLKSKIPLSKYIGVDISSELLDQAVENISSQIEGLEYIKLVKDIERDRIDTAFSYSYSEDKKVANIVLLVGGTTLNSDENKVILQNVRRALSPDDILLFSTDADDPQNNLNFTYSHSPESLVQDTWIPRMLGIDVDKCEFVAEFDTKNNCKVEYIILDKDYSIEFKYNDFNRNITLSKKDKLYLWTYFVTDIHNCVGLFETAGYQLIDSITLPDKKHFMIAVSAE